MMTRLLLASCVAVAGGIAGWVALPRTSTVQWQGYAEADYVKVGPTQQGMLTTVLVARGDRVYPGRPLFTQDDLLDLAARDQAKQQLEQASRQLANLQAPGRPTEIEQAAANLTDAKATCQRRRKDLQRAETLATNHAVSIADLDQSRADFLSAEAKMHACEAALAQSRISTGRDQEIKAQAAMVEAARAAFGMAEWRLSQRRVVAAVEGIVTDVLARPGETLDAGAPVVSILPQKNVFVRFFVPESALASIHYGDEVELAFDHCPGDFLTATVQFISPQAEYTPPVIYSEETRAKLVFRVEARPRPDQAALLNPGQPITVRPSRNAEDR
jgi:HlyD family secretion protein